MKKYFFASIPPIVLICVIVFSKTYASYPEKKVSLSKSYNSDSTATENFKPGITQLDATPGDDAKAFNNAIKRGSLLGADADTYPVEETICPGSENASDGFVEQIGNSISPPTKKIPEVKSVGALPNNNYLPSASKDYTFTDAPKPETSYVTPYTSSNLSEGSDTNSLKIETFTIGSPSIDVFSLQGRPKHVSKFAQGEYWHYGNSSVTIRSGRVCGFKNSGDLNVVMKNSGLSNNRNIFLGSSKDDVLRVQGTPNEVNEIRGRQEWFYGNSSLVFNGNRLTEFSNLDGVLKLKPSHFSDKRFYSINSTAEEVYSVQGPPTQAKRVNNFEQWKYGNSEVSFENGKLFQFSNTGNLLVAMHPSFPTVADSISIGSSADQVLAFKGTPSSIIGNSKFQIWNYDNAKIAFENNFVSEIDSW